MKKIDVKKVMVFDQSQEGKHHPAFLQLMTKAKDIFLDQNVEFICIKGEGTDNPETATAVIEEAVKQYRPELLLIGATSLGEEIAPALGIRLKTGVAAHCVDIKENRDGRMVYMVPAFGGKLIGEIFIPSTKPAIATVKPGIFKGDEKSAGEYEMCMLTVKDLSPTEGAMKGFKLVAKEEAKHRRSSIEKAKLIFCGGFGIGSKESWNKLEVLADKTSGAAGCTRPVVDMDWGPGEYSMIGTSGRTVRPKVYVGFGISGAAHHLCGIKDADVIININNDKEAEVFACSDGKAVLDASAVIDSLLEKMGGK